MTIKDLDIKPIFWCIVAVLCGASFVFGMHMGRGMLDKETQITENTREKTKVVTKIVEKPSGEKVTLITENRDVKSKAKTKVVEKSRVWSVAASAARHWQYDSGWRYTLNVGRKIAKDVSVEGTVASDGYVGFGFRIDF